MLVKAILYEMKSRKIARYPDSLKEACYALLANENILTVFVNIIFQKTPVYDYRTVSHKCRTGFGVLTLSLPQTTIHEDNAIQFRLPVFLQRL
jgi:hypothetical protein